MLSTQHYQVAGSSSQSWHDYLLVDSSDINVYSTVAVHAQRCHNGIHIIIHQRDISSLLHGPTEVFLCTAILILSPETSNHLVPFFNGIWFIHVPFALESVIKGRSVSPIFCKLIAQWMPETRGCSSWKSHFTERPNVYQEMEACAHVCRNG